jgi:hypothetical protein
MERLHRGVDVVIELNGQKFEWRDDCPYKYDYRKVAQAIAEAGTGEEGQKFGRDTFRKLILNDLFFIVYFVLKIPIANCPFVVKACREVEDGPGDFTLDVWAREHFKSTIITIAETIQYVLKNPNEATGIFSYVRPVAKKFLFSIKEAFQNEEILHICFPDIVYANCEKEAPLWSLDEGLILKRTTTRKEPNVSAWGLTEGMPTGFHLGRRVYDDISTEDMADSVDMMEKVKTKFDSSQNLGSEGGHHRVVGTYYHHADPLTYIKGITTPEGEPRYCYRFKPGSDDGTATGVPVFVSQERWNDLRLTRTFNCQQLLDPSPLADMKLNPDFFLPIERRMIPKEVYRFMLVDQAGDLATAKVRSGAALDSWAVGVVAVEPFTDDIGQSRVFLEDIWITPASESEAIDQIVRMYLKAGMIQKIGVEKIGLSSTHSHVQKALQAVGRFVSFDKGGNGILLHPLGQGSKGGGWKKKMIESALSWPLNNSKLYYSTACPSNFIERLKMEMRNFPVWHDDGINMLAYLFSQVLKDMFFALAEEDAEAKKRRAYAPKPLQRSWMGI